MTTNVRRCVFLRPDEKCAIFERGNRPFEEINPRDEVHKRKYCYKANFVECRIYLDEKREPVICPSSGRCRHHPYYPHYRCIKR